MNIEVNLDACSPDELEEWAEVLETMARYANTKRRAMKFRSRGDIPRAQANERECEYLYNQLPEHVRW